MTGSFHDADGRLPGARRRPARGGAGTGAAAIAHDKGEVVVETIAKGLEHPWGLAFLPDGRMLVTERPGRLRLVAPDGQLSEPLGGVPRVAARGQGGLLDVALDPAFAQDRLVYLSLRGDRGGGRAGTAVARGKARRAARPRRRRR